MESGKATLEQAVRLLERLREFDPDMPVQRALVLLCVGRTGVAGMEELSREVNLTLSAISRNVAALGQYGFGKSPGLELVETREDPANRKRKLVMLTGKGKKMLALLVTQ